MIEIGNSLALGFETPSAGLVELLGCKQFKGILVLDHNVLSAKNISHAALAQKRLELVRTANQITGLEHSSRDTRAGTTHGDIVRIIKALVLGQSKTGLSS